MRTHSSLRLGTLHGTTPELLASPWYCAWGFCMVWEAGSPTRRPLLPLNAGTAEPVRVSPPEAGAYPLELLGKPAQAHQPYPLATETELPGVFTQLEGHKQHRLSCVIRLILDRCGHHGLAPP